MWKKIVEKWHQGLTYIKNNGRLITRLILFIAAFINVGCQLLGFTPVLNHTGEFIESLANIFSGLIFIDSFWHNNNFTVAAKEAQEVLTALKEGKDLEIKEIN